MAQHHWKMVPTTPSFKKCVFPLKNVFFQWKTAFSKGKPNFLKLGVVGSNQVALPSSSYLKMVKNGPQKSKKVVTSKTIGKRSLGNHLHPRKPFATRRNQGRGPAVITVVWFDWTARQLMPPCLQCAQLGSAESVLNRNFLALWRWAEKKRRLHFFAKDTI